MTNTTLDPLTKLSSTAATRYLASKIKKGATPKSLTYKTQGPYKEVDLDYYGGKDSAKGLYLDAVRNLRSKYTKHVPKKRSYKKKLANQKSVIKEHKRQRHPENAFNTLIDGRLISTPRKSAYLLTKKSSIEVNMIEKAYIAGSDAAFEKLAVTPIEPLLLGAGIGAAGGAMSDDSTAGKGALRGMGTTAGAGLGVVAGSYGADLFPKPSAKNPAIHQAKVLRSRAKLLGLLGATAGGVGGYQAIKALTGGNDKKK